MIRKAWDRFWQLWGAFTAWAHRLVRYEWAWTLVTALGHGFLTYLGLQLHFLAGVAVATLYTRRELKQARAGSREPLIGSLLDILAPWYVVVFL